MNFSTVFFLCTQLYKTTKTRSLTHNKSGGQQKICNKFQAGAEPFTIMSVTDINIIKIL